MASSAGRKKFLFLILALVLLGGVFLVVRKSVTPQKLSEVVAKNVKRSRLILESKKIESGKEGTAVPSPSAPSIPATSSTELSFTPTPISTPTPQGTRVPEVRLTVDETTPPFSFQVRDFGALMSWAQQMKEALKKESPLLATLLEEELQGRFATYEKELLTFDTHGYLITALLNMLSLTEGEVYIDTAEYHTELFAVVPTTSTTATKLIETLLKNKTRRLLSTENGSEEIAEVSVGNHLLYIGRNVEKTVIGASLRVTANGLRMKKLPETGGSSAAVAFSFHGEGRFNRLMEPLVGASSWPLTLLLSKSSDTVDSSPLITGSAGHAKVFDTFAPKISEALLGAVPADTVAVLLTSAVVPSLTTSTEDWKGIIQGSKAAQEVASKEGGVAFLWDIGANGKGEVGIVVVTDSLVNSAVPFWKASTQNGCAGGRLWIGASSPELFSRMREACDGNSMNLMKARNLRLGGVLTAVVNTEELLRGWLQGAGAMFSADEYGSYLVSASETSQNQFKSERAHLSKELEKVINGLPLITFTGERSEEKGGLKLTGAIQEAKK